VKANFTRPTGWLGGRGRGEVGWVGGGRRAGGGRRGKSELTGELTGELIGATAPSVCALNLGLGF
jgi:hypothetical protein